jgi:hypothetical protein
MQSVDRSKIGRSDLFKSLDEVALPDVRWANIQAQQENLNLLHRQISDVKLSDQVPNDIFVGFETAKNTLVYCYFSYRLSMSATMFAFSTLEMAIARRASNERIEVPSGLVKKLRMAFKKNWIDIRNVATPVNIPEDWNHYVEKAFIPYLQGIRNNLAHEPSHLEFPWQSCQHLQMIATMINEVSVGK